MTHTLRHRELKRREWMGLPRKSWEGRTAPAGPAAANSDTVWLDSWILHGDVSLRRAFRCTDFGKACADLRQGGYSTAASHRSVPRHWSMQEGPPGWS
jgi:hypothetical protein